MLMPSHTLTQHETPLPGFCVHYDAKKKGTTLNFWKKKNSNKALVTHPEGFFLKLKENILVINESAADNYYCIWEHKSNKNRLDV